MDSAAPRPEGSAQGLGELHKTHSCLCRAPGSGCWRSGLRGRSLWSRAGSILHTHRHPSTDTFFLALPSGHVECPLITVSDAGGKQKGCHPSRALSQVGESQVGSGSAPCPSCSPHLLTELRVIKAWEVAQPHLFLPSGFSLHCLFLLHGHPSLPSSTRR